MIAKKCLKIVLIKNKKVKNLGIMQEKDSEKWSYNVVSRIFKLYEEIYYSKLL